MVDWSKCVPKETVIVEPNGERWLFVVWHNGVVLCEQLSIHYTTSYRATCFESATIECTEIDLTKLKPGVSVLKKGSMNECLFLMQCGDNLLVKDIDKSAVHSVPPAAYKDWRILHYE